MKQFFSIALSFVLFISTIGIKVDKHFCASFLHSIQVFGEFDESSCCGEEMEKEVGCCTDEADYFSFKEKYAFSTFNFTIEKPITNLVVPTWSKFTFDKTTLKPENSFLALIKPPPKEVRIHLLNSVFII